MTVAWRFSSALSTRLDFSGKVCVDVPYVGNAVEDATQRTEIKRQVKLRSTSIMTGRVRQELEAGEILHQTGE